MIRQMVDDAKATEASRVALPPGAYYYQGNLSGNSMMIRIPVPKVGLVIGRGGETIREFEQQSRAKIILSSDSSNDINNERAITLIGDEAGIQHAKQLIEDIVYGSPNVSLCFFLQKKKHLNLLSWRRPVILSMDLAPMVNVYMYLFHQL
jgi:far upstream element-binding protein